MAKHTKGPWKATRVGAFSYEIITDLPFGHTNYGVIVSEVRSQENARLIAANTGDRRFPRSADDFHGPNPNPRTA